MVGKIIRQQIQRSPYNYKQVAELLDVDISTMQRFFRSESVQSKYLVGLSKILQVPVKVFFGEEWDTPPAPAVQAKIHLDSDNNQPVQRFFYGFIFQDEKPEILDKLKAIKVTDLEER